MALQNTDKFQEDQLKVLDLLYRKFRGAKGSYSSQLIRFGIYWENLISYELTKDDFSEIVLIFANEHEGIKLVDYKTELTLWSHVGKDAEPAIYWVELPPDFEEIHKIIKDQISTKHNQELPKNDSTLELILYLDNYLCRIETTKDECFLFRNKQGKPSKRLKVLKILNNGNRLSAQAIADLVHSKSTAINKEIKLMFRGIAKKLSLEPDDIYESNQNGYKLKCAINQIEENAP